MRILVVEDDHKIAGALRQGLERQAYAVDVVFTGDDGLNMVSDEKYDLVILDRMLPGKIDGLGILKTMRKNQDHTPVLLLTAKDHVLDRAEGLNAGADDYLVKPFAFLELIARVRALLRRPQQAVETTLAYEDIKLDPERFSLTRGEKHINLTALEFALMEFFMRNPGRVLTKDQIIQSVWNYDANVLPNTVEVYVGYLRNKIDKPFNKSPLIHTRRGFGYYFGLEH